MGQKDIDKIVNQYSQDPVTKKIERVAAYVRVSTQEQKLHGISLDAQKDKLKEYAEKHNLRIVDWYLDEGVSGRKLIKNRRELQRMIRDAEQKKFDRIIFIKLDRFFRSVAEYHECMKRIDPVIWTATEEKYDLSTANGRAFVNMKLTIAELEADQTGERIDLVNDFKVKTGQPLTGSVPFCYAIVPDGERKKLVKNPDTVHIMEDLLAHFQMHQSVHKTVLYINEKYNMKILYKAVHALLQNTLLYGEYRGNPTFCKDVYMDKESFDRMQKMIKRNTKVNTVSRDYIFGGLVRCPNCGNALRGACNHNKSRYGKYYIYKMYRCQKWRLNRSCDYIKAVNENTLEKLMLAEVETFFENAKVKAAKIQDSDSFRIPKKTIDDLNAQIDRLNYSWQTGKIKTVEKYEKQFAELQEKLEKAKAEQEDFVVKDFSHIDNLLHDGWKTIYAALDDAHKRAFWRSFVERIEVDWDGTDKKIKGLKFF